MKRYPSSTPRAGAAIVAVLMTVVTFGLFVLVPATMQLDRSHLDPQATNAAVQMAGEARARYSIG
jgi:hypothetical protein